MPYPAFAPLAFLLQSAPAASNITIGQITAIIAGVAAFAAVVAGAFKMGSVTQRVENSEQNVVAKLTELARRFEAFENFIGGSMSARQEWAGWRAETTAHVNGHDTEHERHGKNIHELRTSIQGIENRLTIAEERRTTTRREEDRT